MSTAIIIFIIGYIVALVYTIRGILIAIKAKQLAEEETDYVYIPRKEWNIHIDKINALKNYVLIPKEQFNTYLENVDKLQKLNVKVTSNTEEQKYQEALKKQTKEKISESLKPKLTIVE